MDQLPDAFFIFRNGAEFEYFEEFPINLLAEFTTITGRPADRILVVSLEYGANFSGPGNDIFRSDRAVGAPGLASASNFLHPVFYYYNSLPTGMKQLRSRNNLIQNVKTFEISIVKRALHIQTLTRLFCPHSRSSSSDE